MTQRQKILNSKSKIKLVKIDVLLQDCYGEVYNIVWDW